MAKKVSFTKKVKMTNKWINKMTKRGKLRKSDKAKMTLNKKALMEKKKRQDKLTDDVNEARCVEDYADPLDMLDSDDDLMKAGQNENNVEEEEEDENENLLSEKSKSGKKFLLPIKTSEGRVVPMSVDDELPPQSDEDDEQDNQAAPIEDAPILNAAQLFAKRHSLLDEVKEKIASLCRHLSEEPENNVNKLKELLSIAACGSDPLVQFAAAKLATASLVEIFCDILPTYKIRELTEEEKNQQMKKETKKLHLYEEALLRNYRKYLQHLENVCKYFQTGKLRVGGILWPPKVAEPMATLAAKSFCRLLVERGGFNFRTNILTVIVPFACNKQESLREIICECLETLFKTDKAGDLSLDAVKAVCLYIKENPFKIHPSLLNVFLKLKIKEVEKRNEKGETAKDRLLARKKKMKLMSRKERKYQKRMEKLDGELKELEAEESKNSILKMHTQIMNQVFATYFRILKKAAKPTFLPPVLEGLAKFAQLINVEFFDDLIATLYDLLNSGTLKPLESLHCVQTVFVILSGEGQSLNIDPFGFYKFVYRLIPKLVDGKSKTEPEMFSRQFSLFLHCLDSMFNKRRKQITVQRAAAFVKRLAVAARNAEPPIAASLLLTIRSFFVTTPKLDVLVDAENQGGGFGAYLSQLDDPDRCNAAATTIIEELTHLNKNCEDQTVKQIAKHLLNWSPTEQSLFSLANKEPWTIFDDLTRKYQEQMLEEENHSKAKRRRKT